MSINNNNATSTHSFAVYCVASNDFMFVSVDAGDDYAEFVYAGCDGDSWEGTHPVACARLEYTEARESGRLLSMDAAQSVIDGEARLVKLTQKGRSFYRAVKGSPFRYASACATRSGVKTGYDVVNA